MAENKEELANWSRKPIRYSYQKNKQHKINSLHAYYLIDLHSHTSLMQNKVKQTLTKFNFKKTNAHKMKYSCGGYGGKCTMCSNVYNEGKLTKKVRILNGQCSDTFMCIKSEIDLY